MVCGGLVLTAVSILAEPSSASAKARQRAAAPPWPLSELFGVSKPRRARARKQRAPASKPAEAKFRPPETVPWPPLRPGAPTPAPKLAEPPPKPPSARPPPPAVPAPRLPVARPQTPPAAAPPLAAKPALPEVPAQGSAPAAPPPQASAPASPPDRSVCRARLAALAVATQAPPVSGPGACGIGDPVRLEAIITRGERRVVLAPPALLDCEAAEAITNWVRDEAAPALPAGGAQLSGITVAASYDCRGRNRVVGAKISQHGFGKALDVGGFTLTDHSSFKLTDPAVDKALRERLRASACERFATVLGPGSDGYHEQHIHLDVIVRRSGYRLCQWDVR